MTRRQVGLVVALMTWLALASEANGIVRPHRCVPPRSQVIARSPQAVITSNFTQDPRGGDTISGCLLARGRERVLEVIPRSDPPGSVLAATSGHYAAVVTQGGDKGGNIGGSTSVFELRTGRRARFGAERYACSVWHQICGRIDQVVVGAGGVSAVHLDSGATGFSTTVSCAPAASMCLAQGLGDFSSTAPARSPWTSMPFSDATRLACASTTLCVATSGSTIYASTNPTSGSPTWTATQLPSAALTQASCPSTNLCLVATRNGNVWWSNDPTGGAGAWSSEDVDNSFTINALACPSTTECVATDEYGRAISTSDPTGGAGDWRIRQVFNPPGSARDVSCPSTSLCVAVRPSPFLGNSPGAFAVTTDPTAGQWSISTAPEPPNSVECPSVSMCIAIGTKVMVSTNPASGTWSSYSIQGLNEAYSASCWSAEQCVVGGNTGGSVFVSSNPAAGRGTWLRVLVGPESCGEMGVVCGTEKIIASDRSGVHTLASSTEYEPQTGPQLTGMTITGDTLSWNDHGSPKTAQLAP